MKTKKMMAGVLAVVSLFCMSITAVAAPTQEFNSIERQNEARIAAAKEIAYMDVSSASAEMQERILEARETIIESKSWVADGWTTTITHADGTVENVPTFSECFPGWDMPVCKSDDIMGSARAVGYDSPFSRLIRVSLPKASSTTNAPTAFYVYDIREGLDVCVNKLFTSTSCNLGLFNIDLGYSIDHLVNLRVGDRIATNVDIAVDPPANIAVRASTYVTPGSADLDCEAW